MVQATEAIRLVRAEAVAASLERLDALGGAALAPSAERPILLCSIGWGTGSTLVQRVVMTDATALIWGEPMGRMGWLSHWAEALSAANGQWPREAFFELREGAALTADFVANMYPSVSDLLSGLRGFVDGWLAEPARRRGFSRWGMKEVRWGAAEALLLQRLYADARFVVIVRHPADAWVSSREMGTWWRHAEPIDSVERFAALWAALAGEWAAWRERLGAVTIRYEDLIAGAIDFDALGEQLGLKLAPHKAMKHKAGSRSAGARATETERTVIGGTAGAAMDAFGYS